MRKVYLTLALLALPIIAAHACGGDDTTPGSAGSRDATATATVSGSGAATGSSTTSGSTTTGTGGSAGR